MEEEQSEKQKRKERRKERRIRKGGSRKDRLCLAFITDKTCCRLDLHCHPSSLFPLLAFRPLSCGPPI
jgi:hypothetical protein